ncbi:transient-receptor-potential-like protein, partial [Frankliniella occidentalis]|uniref:Transient-receptor-potential-like protein n=1 Tax=Frankliniella occidentalis TaxID=133901 RepID=A0A9C6WS55_FRAOC
LACGEPGNFLNGECRTKFLYDPKAIVLKSALAGAGRRSIATGTGHLVWILDLNKFHISYVSLFEATQSLFWASFGNVGIDTFELTGIKQYTRFWGLLMFGAYSVINIIVLLNLLIAMMSNSYAMIEERSDTEWKFARTRLWMSYFEEGATLPPPFNILPTPKRLMHLIRPKSGLRRMSTKRKERVERERDYRYSAVMRALVWRYVSKSHRACIEAPVTEDDVNEVKGDISALRCDLLEVMSRNGFDVSAVRAADDRNPGNKRQRVWERRLLKDFHVAPVATVDEEEQLIMAAPPENETGLQRFRRVAKLAVLQASTMRWRQVVQGLCQASQIGRCHSRESFMNQQNLQRAMEEARRLVLESDKAGRGTSPMPPLPVNNRNFSELLRDEKRPEDAGSTATTTLHPFAERQGSLMGTVARAARRPAAATPATATAAPEQEKHAVVQPEVGVVPQSPAAEEVTAFSGALGLEDDAQAQIVQKSDEDERTSSSSSDGGLGSSDNVHDPTTRPRLSVSQASPEFLSHPILRRRDASPDLFADARDASIPPSWRATPSSARSPTPRDSPARTPALERTLSSQDDAQPEKQKTSLSADTSPDAYPSSSPSRELLQVPQVDNGRSTPPGLAAIQKKTKYQHRAGAWL